MALTSSAKAKATLTLLLALAQLETLASPWDWQSVNVKVPSTTGAYSLNQPSQHPVTLLVNGNVTAEAGTTAFLPCRVKDLGEYTVSWLRGRDMRVLSVGHMTFSSDHRYHVVQVPRLRLEADDWNLEIKAVTPRDSGWYECQVNTEPKISNKSYLNVIPARKEKIGTFQTSVLRNRQAQVKVQGLDSTQRDLTTSTLAPVATIGGPRVMKVSPGDSLTLECQISRLSRPPSSLYWLHNGQPLTPKSRPGLSLESQKLMGFSSSRLEFAQVSSVDQGTYKCITELTSPVEVELLIDSSDDVAALASHVSSSSVSSSKSVALIMSLKVVILHFSSGLK